MKRPFKIIWLFCLLGLMNFVACTLEKDHRSHHDHYFLDGYDDLEFVNEQGETVPTSRFIRAETINNVQSYTIRDHSLTLVNKKTKEPYTGYIRTYHFDIYNLQGEFEEGKIHRLRYWHSNRTLGMDKNFKTQTASLWNISGKLMVQKNAEETYYYFADSNQIKEIITDSSRNYFNRKGELSGYSIAGDSTFTSYYADGTRRLVMPYKDGNFSKGKITRWYRNGQLETIGQYDKEGEQIGTWIKYDSLGNEMERITYPLE